MNFQAFDLKNLPKKNTGPKVDIAAARALLDLINANGAATDGTSYENADKARTAGMRASRLLAHVAPDGKRPTIRTFALSADDGKPNGKFGFTIYLTDAKQANEKEKGKGKG